ncbi:MAG: AraC family ligand binding domain-containing protein [Actinomycetota bacterium]
MGGARRSQPGASRTDALAAFSSEKCGAASSWSNGPMETYGRHEHGYHKVLFCLSGSITFRTDDGEIELSAGDRLDLEPGTTHSAAVGPRGCRCIEASR